MPRYLFSFISICIVGFLLAGPGESRQQRLVITGSSTVAPLVAEVARAFEQHHPDTRVDVQTGGSSRGIADCRSGVNDIGMVSRALSDTETDLYGTALAMDGICIIVHRDNTVTALTDSQIRNIYTGAIADWKDVGGAPGPIVVVNKADGRSTLELFLKYFELDATQIKASVVIGDNEQGIKTIAGNRQAIGYVSVGAAEYAAGSDITLRLLPMNGVNASRKAVASGSYPLARPLTLVTRGAPDGLAAEFINFATSAETDAQIEKLFFVR
jgi:phosphate transport system substrate-binding protein